MDHRSAQNEVTIRRTQAWLEKAVIGLNLCPFAKAVHVKDQIRYQVSSATNPEELLRDLVFEFEHLQATDPEKTDTTLLIHPGTLGIFLDQNDFMGIVDATLSEMDLEGTLQVANFHPQFQFAGTKPDDLENYMNRAPYPTLHLLRESSVERAVSSYPDTDKISKRNIETLMKLGLKGWNKLQV